MINNNSNDNLGVKTNYTQGEISSNDVQIVLDVPCIKRDGDEVGIQTMINLREFFSGKTRPTINYYFERNPDREYYIKNSCIHNDLLDIDESEEGYIAQGKCGVVRKGWFISADGSRKDVILKIFISSILNTVELEEIKYAIELNKLMPDYVIKILFIEKCDLLNSETGDNVNGKKEIIILGMEQGISNLSSYLLSVEHNLHEFERVLSLALDACDSINRSGYFHRDIKPANVVIVNRNGINVPVLIDFGAMCYMSNIDQLYNLSDRNPPLDCFYLSLHILYMFEKIKHLRPLCLHYAFKFYRILRFYIPGDIHIKNINTFFFNHYFDNPTGSDYVDNVFLKYFTKSGASMDVNKNDTEKYINNRVTGKIENILDSVEIKKYNTSSVLYDIIKTELKNLTATSGSPNISNPQPDAGIYSPAKIDSILYSIYLSPNNCRKLYSKIEKDTPVESSDGSDYYDGSSTE